MCVGWLVVKKKENCWLVLMEKVVEGIW